MYDDCVHVHSVHNHTRMHVGMHTSLCKRVIDHDVAHVRACHVNVKRNEVNAAAGGHHLAVALIVAAAGFKDAVKNCRTAGAALDPSKCRLIHGNWSVSHLA